MQLPLLPCNNSLNPTPAAPRAGASTPPSGADRQQAGAAECGGASQGRARLHGGPGRGRGPAGGARGLPNPRYRSGVRGGEGLGDPGLRDEIYVQLCRQTNDNPSLCVVCIECLLTVLSL